jgi:hypothetical protein
MLRGGHLMALRRTTVRSRKRPKRNAKLNDFTFDVGDTIEYREARTGEVQYGRVQGMIGGNPIMRRITKEAAGLNPKRFTPRLPCSIDRSVSGSLICSSHGEDLIGIIESGELESPLPGHIKSWLCPVSNETMLEDA